MAGGNNNDNNSGFNYPNEILDADEIETHLPDGTPITYDDDIPELMRYKPMLTRGDLELLKKKKLPTTISVIKTQLDSMDHFDRLCLGSSIWNLWVKLHKQTWFRFHGSTAKIQTSPKNSVIISTASSQKNLLKNNGIFDGLVFPNTVKFRISFEDSSKVSGAFFTNCQFAGHADFASTFYEISYHNCTFYKDADFTKRKFAGLVRIRACVFKETTTFNGSLFHADLQIDQSTFNEVSFTGCEIRGYTTISNVTCCGKADFQGTKFLGGCVSFEDTKFNSHTNFDGAVFVGGGNSDNVAYNINGIRSIDFIRTEFEHSLSISNAFVFGDIRFSGCKIQYSIYLRATHFLGQFRFESNELSGTVDFDHAVFGKITGAPPPAIYKTWSDVLRNKYDEIVLTYKSMTVPDFRGTYFKLPPNLTYTDIISPPILPASTAYLVNDGEFQRLIHDLKHFFGFTANKQKIKDNQAAAKFRRLQELAAQGHNHHAEARFFREELLARRGHETNGPWEVTIINLFESFSECGLSFWRPIKWWLRFFFIVFAPIYGFGTKLSGWQFWNGETLGHLFNYTLSNAALVGLFRGNDTVAVNALFGGPEGIPFWTSFIAGVHNLIASILLFLALLAIRNYFKMR